MDTHIQREILLVDDERTLLLSLSTVLSEAGYAVRVAMNGNKALKAIAQSRPDLVLLDVTMPGKCGFDVCREIRKSDATLPIAFLTALDTPHDELKGLSAGGDIYISKTTPDEVLLARIAAVLRLRNTEEGVGDFDFGSWHIEAANFRMRAPFGRVVHLTDRDIALLRLFKAHPGEVFSRDALATKFWGVAASPRDNSVSVVLSRLRRKLGHVGDLIHVIYGTGYSFRP